MKSTLLLSHTNILSMNESSLRFWTTEVTEKKHLLILHVEKMLRSLVLSITDVSFSLLIVTGPTLDDVLLVSITSGADCKYRMLLRKMKILPQELKKLSLLMRAGIFGSSTSLKQKTEALLIRVETRTCWGSLQEKWTHTPIKLPYFLEFPMKRSMIP
ncbi:hypothetical protein D3C81_1552910 [compost metagenome]